MPIKTLEHNIDNIDNIDNGIVNDLSSVSISIVSKLSSFIGIFNAEVAIAKADYYAEISKTATENADKDARAAEIAIANR
jgi:hypothetical protein